MALRSRNTQSLSAKMVISPKSQHPNVSPGARDSSLVNPASLSAKPHVVLINDCNYSPLYFNQKPVIIEKVCKLKTNEVLPLIKSHQRLRHNLQGGRISLPVASCDTDANLWLFYSMFTFPW